MPHYILNDDIALRAYRALPFCYYRRGDERLKRVSKEEFAILLSCDGQHESETNEIIQKLLAKNIIKEKRNEDEALKSWQEFRICDNRVTPYLNLEITQHCNCNCMHCFNATGNDIPKEEPSLEQLIDILDQAYECGCFALTVTGGEPLIRKDFPQFLEEVYSRGMFIQELNTNGYFITRELLDFFKEHGDSPLMKISFDGIGFHDQMRGKKGMEEAALSAIRLCTEEGFRVKVQMNLNKLNAKSILPSLELLDEMGVYNTRIIRTVETPRWAKNHVDESLSWKEYYEKALEITKDYCEKEHRMMITIWMYATLIPTEKRIEINYEPFHNRDFNDHYPTCRCIRGMPAVGANGNIYPCMQMSGFFEMHGINMGNVFRDKLSNLIDHGTYHDAVYTTVGERARHNTKCLTCEHYERCGGGCPALGLLYGNDLMAADITKCELYKNGFDKKIEALASELGYEPD